MLRGSETSVSTPSCACRRLKHRSRGFPGGSVSKNPPADSGDMGSMPGLGRTHTPRATEPGCHTTEPEFLEPGAAGTAARTPPGAHSPQREKPAPRAWRAAPLTAARAKPVPQCRPCTARNQSINKLAIKHTHRSKPSMPARVYQAHLPCPPGAESPLGHRGVPGGLFQGSPDN